MWRVAVLCSSAAGKVSNLSSPHAELDFTPNKVNGMPPTQLERRKDITLHDQEEMCKGPISQKHMEG